MYIDTIASAREFDRVDDMVAVIVVYRRPVQWTDYVLKRVCGEFTHCELYMPTFGGTFFTTVDNGMEFRLDIKQIYQETPEDYAWHLIPVTRAECRRLWAWNMNQVHQHCQYNYRDLLWQVAPYMRPYVHDLTDQDAMHPTKMFCSQAVVLALRATFVSEDSSPHMRAFALSMNSRITTPCDVVSNANRYLGTAINITNIPITPGHVNIAMDRALADASSLRTKSPFCV